MTGLWQSQSEGVAVRAAAALKAKSGSCWITPGGVSVHPYAVVHRPRSGGHARASPGAVLPASAPMEKAPLVSVQTQYVVTGGVLLLLPELGQGQGPCEAAGQAL